MDAKTSVSDNGQCNNRPSFSASAIFYLGKPDGIAGGKRCRQFASSCDVVIRTHYGCRTSVSAVKESAIIVRRLGVRDIVGVDDRR
jgi:hypothetical protein